MGGQFVESRPQRVHEQWRAKRRSGGSADAGPSPRAVSITPCPRVSACSTLSAMRGVLPANDDSINDQLNAMGAVVVEGDAVVE